MSHKPQLSARSHTQPRDSISHTSAEPESDANPLSIALTATRPEATPFPSTPPSHNASGLSLLLPITEHLGMAQEAADHKDMDGVIANVLNAIECEEERALKLWERGHRLEALRGIACTCRSAERIINEVCG